MVDGLPRVQPTLVQLNWLLGWLYGWLAGWLADWLRSCVRVRRLACACVHAYVLLGARARVSVRACVCVGARACVSLRAWLCAPASLPFSLPLSCLSSRPLRHHTADDLPAGGRNESNVEASRRRPRPQPSLWRTWRGGEGREDDETRRRNNKELAGCQG